MKQKKLEGKVRELFEQQGFELEEEKNGFSAVKGEQNLSLKVFSSEEFSREEVTGEIQEGQKVFVDEGLEGLDVENQVSVIREEEKEEYELPSYELIGEIAVINELTVEEHEAVEGIKAHHPSVKTILLKEEPLKGEFRVGGYRKLYGEETETVHKEFNCRFKVDPTKVYYSERFSTERKRVVDQIEDGEKVLVMFAGVGPFGIMAAKHSQAEKVVMIEKNPIAADYMKQNIELNKVGDTVEGIEGDVQEIVPELDENFDRIIMPLPEKAEEFLGLAEEVLAEDGVVHLYTFSGNNHSFGNFEVLEKTFCGQRGPDVDRICLDVIKNS